MPTLKKISERHARGLKGITDWAKVEAMTDEEIRQAIGPDRQSHELAPHELVSFLRGNNPVLNKKRSIKR